MQSKRRYTRCAVMTGMIATCSLYSHAITVNLKRYQGRWYTQRYTPNLFDIGTRCQYTDYQLHLNHFTLTATAQRPRHPDHPLIRTGESTPINSAHSRLSTHFHWPFWGEADIIYLDDHYRYAIVTSPNRHYAWINSRAATINATTLAALTARAQRLGLSTTGMLTRPNDCLPDESPHAHG